MNSSIIEKELDDMIANDDEIRRHKQEIEMIKKEHKKELQKYLKKEIGKFINFTQKSRK